MNVKEQYSYNFPSYALSALINGDYSGLEQEDIDNLDAFLKRENYIDVWDVDSNDEGSFCKHPEFGLSCDCVDVTGIVWE